MVWKETSASLKTLAESGPFAFLSNGFARIFWKSKMFQGTWGGKGPRYFRLASVADLPCYPGVFPLYQLKTSSPTGLKNEHMTSRRPYCCSKTIKRWPCLCSTKILWELNSFLMQTFSFVAIILHRCWPREWKRSIFKLLSRNEVIA